MTVVLFTIAFLVIPLGVAAYGVVILIKGIRDMIRAVRSVNWPSAVGTILNSEVEIDKSGEGITYHAKISYEFAIDGIMHKGDRLAYGHFGYSEESRAQRIVERYPKGKTVTIHHMPDRPKECLLETGCKSETWEVPLSGLFFIVLGGMFPYVVFFKMAAVDN